MAETNTSNGFKVSTNNHPSQNSPINNLANLSHNEDHSNQCSSNIEKSGTSFEEECKTFAPNNRNKNDDISEILKEKNYSEENPTIDLDAKKQIMGNPDIKENSKMDIEPGSEHTQERSENYHENTLQKSNSKNSKEMQNVINDKDLDQVIKPVIRNENTENIDYAEWNSQDISHTTQKHTQNPPIYNVNNDKQFNQRQSYPNQPNDFNAEQYYVSSNQNARNAPHKNIQNIYIRQDYQNNANKLKCLVPNCNESHYSHYCKFCGNPNSIHFSSQCAKNPQNVRNLNNIPRPPEDFIKPRNDYQSMGQPMPQKTCSFPNCPENHPDHHFCKFFSKSNHLSRECRDKPNNVGEFNQAMPMPEHQIYSQGLPIIEKKNYFVNDAYYDLKIKPVSETSKSFFSRFFGKIKKLIDFFKIGKSDTTIKLPHEDKSKWQEISRILAEFIDGKIQTFGHFEYNMEFLHSMGSPYLMGKMNNFRYFLDENDKSWKINFFGEILPFMANLALKLPELFPKELNILVQNKNDKLEFTKIQVSCLIAHMFFGTISGRNSPKMHEIISFQQILCLPDQANIQKLFCLFNYFKRVMSWDGSHMNLKIEFSRKVSEKVKPASYWLVSKEVLLPFKIVNKGGIEAKEIKNSIQVNFANKFIGGGALTSGTVQEEIRYFVSPECLPSIMLFECFENHEVGYLFGTEKINAYKGYSSTFTYEGDFNYAGDFPTVSQNNEKGDMLDDSMLALDAIHFRYYSEQYSEENILRELNKAYLGFKTDPKKDIIMTGKWGCGVFKGDPQLKFLLQWIACSQCKKEMMFFSVGDTSLEKADLMLSLKVDVGALMEKILKFRPNGSMKLFEYVLSYD